MKFYKKDIPGLYLPGIIWNPNTNRQWCSFDDGGGVVETENPQLIEVLMKYGYPHDEVKEEPIEEVKEEPKKEEVVEKIVEEFVGKNEVSDEFFANDEGSLGMDTVIKTEAPSPKYKSKSELNKALKSMDKDGLEAFAKEEFGVDLDKRRSWSVLQKEVKKLGEAALEK